MQFNRRIVKVTKTEGMHVNTELEWQIEHDRVIVDNVKVIWNDHGRWAEDWLGQTVWEFTVDVLQRYILHRQDFTLPFDAKEDLGDVNMFVEDDTFETTNSDFAISLLAFLIGEGEGATVYATCDHIFWVVHDILHAEKDYNISGYDDAYITSHLERDRHLEAFRLCVEHNVIRNSDYGLFEKLCTEQSTLKRQGTVATLTLDELIEYAKHNVEEFDSSVFTDWTEDYMEFEDEEELEYEPEIGDEY